MPAPEITEEDIMNNDVDPLDGIREIRREEGVAEEDLPERDEGADHARIEEQEEKDELDTTESTTGDTDAEGASDDAGETGQAGDGNAEEPEQSKDSDDKSEEDPDAEKGDGQSDDAESAAEKPELLKFRANGHDFEFTQEEALAQFQTVFGQAANFTQKMQAIAPYRKMISALEQEGVTQDNLNLALDALKGDKGAIKKLLEQNKLDAYDLTSDEESAAPYAPTNYGKDEVTLEIDEVISTIRNDEEFKITTNVIDDQWDESSRVVIANNPQYITGLHNDIKSGVYDKVSPTAMKMKVLDGNTKSDIEYYMIAGEQFRVALEAEDKLKNGQKQVDELNKDAQSADSKFEEASSQATRKRAASSTGARADRKGVIDYMDDNDEAYDEWYKNNVTNKM